MNMRKIFLLLFPVSFFLFSCQYFEKKIPSQQELLQQELKNINWNQVDEFPSIDSCNRMDRKEERQQCFFSYLTKVIQKKLSVDTLSILYPNIDTIQVRVTVFANAVVEFEPLLPQDSMKYDKVRIDSVILNRLSDFPNIHPALKRGIPVKTQFILPVIVTVED